MQVSVSSLACRLVLALLISLPSVSTASDEPVGRVLIAMGSVTAEREGVSSRGLGRNDPVHAGDTIRTGARGRAQIRFTDGGMVDLEADSAFEVNEYRDDDDGGSVVMSFVRGAMRTITGAIGAGSNDSYRMNTSVATLGVRGTAYSLRYCDATCASEGGEAGLYGRVDDGAVSVDGAGGTGTFGAGQFFFVPDSGTPRRIVAPPEGILDGGDEGGDEGGDDEQIEDVEVRPTDSSDDDGASVDGGADGDDLLDPGFEQSENEDIAARPGESIDAAFSGAYIGSSGFGVYESPGGGDVREDEDGRIVGAEFDGYGFVDATDLEHTGGVTEVIDFEAGETFDVSWGSWAAEPGTVEDGDIAGFTYAVTEPGNFTTATEIAELAGSVGSFRSYFDQDGPGGGPPAIDSNGAVWNVLRLTLGVDFGMGLTGAEVEVAPDGSEDSLIVSNFSETDPIGSLNDDGTFSVNNLGGLDAEGALEGRFLGRNAAGALVAFEVRELDGDRRIVGTRVLGQGE